MPLYFASIAFSVAVSFACGGAMRFANGDVIKAPTPVNVLATALMLQGIVALGLPSDGQVWSLAVEWWCYMAAPFLRRYKLIMAVFAIGSFVYFLQLDANYASSLHARSLLGLSWMWIAGFLFFSMRRKGAGILMLIVPPLIAYLHGTFTGAPLFLTLGLLIVSDAVSFQKSTRAILNWLGDISYPIYLFHFAGIMALTSLGIRNNTLDFLACVVLAIALFYIIDYPIRLIKSKGRCPNLAQPTLNPLTSVPSADDVSLELTSDKAA
jgi:peptidoglycan/LPS O-acetylase OafA/YrhL